MYSEDDINSAVAAGALTPEAASAFRAHMSAVREMPRSDEENFRLINSFNDVFVAIGAVIMLVAAGSIGNALGHAMTASAIGGDLSTLLAGLLVAGTAWVLSEFFTRRRRMALPGIVLLLAFVGASYAATLGLGGVMGGSPAETFGSILASVAGIVAAGAAWLHWRRFMVPITVAAGAAALAATLVSFITVLLDQAGVADSRDILIWLALATGLAIFAYAMRWDMSDPARTTRRSDVAFWLHLVAAPLIAHPVFYGLGLVDGGRTGVGGAVAVLAIYVVFGLVALAVDRRALLVSALAYVLIALAFLIDRFGAVELSFALTALVIGSALLTLSAFWTTIRARVVVYLPAGLQARLPEIAPPAARVAA